MLKQSAFDKFCASFPSRLHMCLGNRGQSISRDLFRLDGIPVHVDAPELRTASEGKTLLKELCTRRGEMSRALEGWSADAIKNRRSGVLPHARQEKWSFL
jgi:hypothetical protein